MALQHLRSNTASKRPTPASMADGQLAINTNATSPGLFFKDAGGALIKVGPVHVGTSAPNSSPAAGGSTGNAVGEQWLDTSGGNYVFKIWDGSAWRSEAGEFVDAAGDTMTGALILPSGTAAAPALGVGSTDNGLYSPGADQVAISTNGTGRLIVRSNGDIEIPSGTQKFVNSSGVGAFNIEGGFPEFPLEATGVRVSPRTTGLRALSVSGLSGQTGDLFQASTSSGIPLFRIEAGGTISLRNANYIRTTQAEDLKFGTNNTERLRITSDGKLGLGTSTVGARFHIEDTDSSSAYTTGAILGTQTSIYKQIVHTNQSTGTNEAGIVLRAGASSNIAEWGLSAVRTGATSGDLVFRTRTGAATSAERFRIDSSGRLGLGTSSPVQTLTVSSSTNYEGIYVGGNAAPSVTFANGVGIWKTGNSGNDGSAFSISKGTANDDKLIIDSSGRVGIGTTSPDRKLHVNTDNAAAAKFGGTGAGDFAIEIGQLNAGGSPGFNATGGSSMLFEMGGSEAMRIDSSGRLLVGTSSSRGVGGNIQSNLQIEGTGTGGNTTSCSVTQNSNDATGPRFMLAKSRSTSNGGVTVVQSGDSLGIIDFAGADGTDAGSSGVRISAEVDGTPGANDMPCRLVFSTTADGASSPTERMRITNNGRVGIGLIPTGSFSDGVGVQLGPYGSVLSNRTSDPSGAFGRNTTTGTVVSLHYGSTPTNPITVGTISVTASSTAYNTSSDYRLKENVVDIVDGITRVKQLQPKRFNFIIDADTTVDGFLAHEAQAVVPEAVTGTKDEVDENGDPVMQGIDQSKLVPLLTAALQEAIGEIESLKARVAALESA